MAQTRLIGELGTYLTDKLESPQAAGGSQSSAKSARHAATPGVRQSRDERENPFGTLSSATVMMVDDDPLMLEVVQTYLEEAGYTSFVTTSKSTEAMRILVERRPEILLLDLKMPRVSGFDILAEARAHDELRYHADNRADCGERSGFATQGAGAWGLRVSYQTCRSKRIAVARAMR